MQDQSLGNQDAKCAQQVQWGTGAEDCTWLTLPRGGSIKQVTLWAHPSVTQKSWAKLCPELEREHVWSWGREVSLISDRVAYT